MTSLNQPFFLNHLIGSATASFELGCRPVSICEVCLLSFMHIWGGRRNVIFVAFFEREGEVISRGCPGEFVLRIILLFCFYFQRKHRYTQSAKMFVPATKYVFITISSTMGALSCFSSSPCFKDCISNCHLSTGRPIPSIPATRSLR